MSYTSEQLHILRAMAFDSKNHDVVSIPDALMPAAVAEAAGITQAALARFLGVTQTMLTTVESGKVKKPATYIAALKRAGLWVD